MFDVVLKAAYLGLSGVGLSAAMAVYLLYGSLKTGSRIGSLMFAGHLAVSILAGGITILGGSGIFTLSSVSAGLNFAGAAACCALGASLLVSVFRDHAYLCVEALREPPATPEGYADLYAGDNDCAHREAEYDYRVRKGNGEAFLWGLLFTVTNVKWLQWCGIPAKSLTIRAFETGEGGIGGFLLAALFLVVLALGEWILFLVLSKLISLLQRVTPHWLFRVFSGAAGGSFVVFGLLLLWEMIKNLQMLGAS